MFYQIRQQISEEEVRGSAIFVLTPSESKRLIAKAVAMLPEVRQALQKGTVIIARGTTNAFVAEEILSIKHFGFRDGSLVETPISKVDYAAGIIVHGELRETAKERRLVPFVLKSGQVAKISYEEALNELRAGDVLIKGANAVDPEGNAGVILGDEAGGTIGRGLPIVSARGCHLVVPVGLEKMIPSVLEASQRCGIYRFKYSSGMPVGYMPLVNALVVTEIQAFEVLTGANATHIASGGIGGSEGSVVLAVEGSHHQVELAFALVKSLKKEPPLPAPTEV